MIEVRCFNSFAEAAFLRDRVNALNLQSTRPDPFSTFEFFETFFRHDEYFPEGQGLQLWFLTAFEANRLIGYVALKQTAHTVFGVPTSTLDLFVAHDTDRPHLVADRALSTEVSAAIYDYLLARNQEWSLLAWQQQDTGQLLPPRALAGYRVLEWPCMENCTIHIQWSTLSEYAGALSKKFRTNVSRQMRHLLAAGNVEWLSSSDERLTPMLFELYLGIERRSWKARASAHIGRSPERIAYAKALLDARQPMRVSIQVLLLDGVPIAGLIGGSFMRGLYALHIAYDANWSRFAPGSAILLMGMRQAIEGRYAFFNLLSGFKYYKARWLATITDTRIVQIYRVGGLSYWHRLLGDGKRWLFAAALAPMRFNAARRGADKIDFDESAVGRDNPISGHADAHERLRNCALVDAIRAGGCDSLSATQLATLLPLNVIQNVR